MTDQERYTELEVAICEALDWLYGLGPADRRLIEARKILANVMATPTEDRRV